MATSQPLPHYGRRLTPCLLDSEAEKNPTRLFAVVTKSANLSDGFRQVDYDQMANAVNSVAHDLIVALGEPEYPFETLTYVGTVDLRYNIIFYAAVKCGYKVSRNSCVVGQKYRIDISIGLFPIAEEPPTGQHKSHGTNPVSESCIRSRSGTTHPGVHRT